MGGWRKRRLRHPRVPPTVGQASHEAVGISACGGNAAAAEPEGAPAATPPRSCASPSSCARATPVPKSSRARLARHGDAEHAGSRRRRGGSSAWEVRAVGRSVNEVARSQRDPDVPRGPRRRRRSVVAPRRLGRGNNAARQLERSPQGVTAVARSSHHAGRANGNGLGPRRAQAPRDRRRPRVTTTVRMFFQVERAVGGAAARTSSFRSLCRGAAPDGGGAARARRGDAASPACGSSAPRRAARRPAAHGRAGRAARLPQACLLARVPRTSAAGARQQSAELDAPRTAPVDFLNLRPRRRGARRRRARETSRAQRSRPPARRGGRAVQACHAVPMSSAFDVCARGARVDLPRLPR